MTMTMQNYQNKSKVKLLILDVDGVLTDGTRTVDINGDIVAKQFFDRDFYYTKLLQQKGVKVVCISGDNRINEPWCRNKGLNFLLAISAEDKLKTFTDLIHTLDLTYNETTFVGDSIIDLPCMILAGISFAPANAEPEVSIKSKVNLKASGGYGVVEEVYSYLVKHQLI